MGRDKDSIKWPDEFIQEIKEWFPEDFDLIKALEEGNDFVLHRLYGLKTFAFSAKEVVGIFKKGKEKTIYQKAKECLKTEELYEKAKKISGRKL